MPLHQYDYLFAIGTIFAFLDAWNIGANDVANSWATSISSRSVTYLQAMILASIMEFGGSIGVGAQVADTIRTKVLDVDSFEGNPPLLMLGMVCAVVSSSLFLTFATKFGMPVSTTHSIMGGVIGVGIASLGSDGVSWWGGNINSGVVQVFLAWIIAPLASGAFAAIIFLFTKYAVLLRKNALRNGLYTVPIYFGITSGLLTMLIVWKGGKSRIDLTDAQTIGTVFGVFGGMILLTAIFLVPWLYRKVVMEDWELTWYHIPMGPLLLRRGEVAPPPEGLTTVQDYYRGHKTLDELTASRGGSNDVESEGDLKDTPAPAGETTSSGAQVAAETEQDDFIFSGPRPEGSIFNPAVIFWYAKRSFLRGVEKDVVAMQNKRNILTTDLDTVHAHAERFDNKTEYLFSFLQILTAATASFTHGANDVANAVGPYATIYYIWRTNDLQSESPVPYWILAFGGIAIVIGLWTYGYNIVRNLGNRLTLHSPSRGFAMELGSAVTVIMATKLQLPISTTQCISGATVGVGLCNGTWRTINWRMIAWIYFGWIITLPVTGIISGCLMGIIINAPRWGMPN